MEKLKSMGKCTSKHLCLHITCFSRNALTILSRRTESSSSNQTSASSAPHVPDSDTSTPSQTQEIQNLLAELSFNSSLGYMSTEDSHAKMEYELLGLSITDVAESHPISYPLLWDDDQLDLSSGK